MADHAHGPPRARVWPPAVAVPGGIGAVGLVEAEAFGAGRPAGVRGPGPVGRLPEPGERGPGPGESHRVDEPGRAFGIRPVTDVGVPADGVLRGVLLTHLDASMRCGCCACFARWAA